MTSTIHIRVTHMAGPVCPSSFPLFSFSPTFLAGPTPALSFHVLGIQITGVQGSKWAITPVLSGLKSAEGGLETSLGFFRVKWNVRGNTLMLIIQTPAGTRGTVTLPGIGPLSVDKRIQSESSGVVELRGGKHTITRRL